MERSSKTRVGLLTLLVVSAACEQGDITGPAIDSDVGVFASLMNDHRVSVGCEPLVWDSEVADVAYAHSVDMTEREYFAHDTPDGLSPFDRLRAAGLDFRRAAENIAYGYGTPEAVLQGWLDSPGHRANIENCELTEHGVGLHSTRWTHLFRTP